MQLCPPLHPVFQVGPCSAVCWPGSSSLATLPAHNMIQSRWLRVEQAPGCLLDEAWAVHLSRPHVIPPHLGRGITQKQPPWNFFPRCSHSTCSVHGANGQGRAAAGPTLLECFAGGVSDSSVPSPASGGLAGRSLSPHCLLMAHISTSGCFCLHCSLGLKHVPSFIHLFIQAPKAC